MSDYWCHVCGERCGMMGHSDCQNGKPRKPRVRVNQYGWIKHRGGPSAPPWIKDADRLDWFPHNERGPVIGSLAGAMPWQYDIPGAVELYRPYHPSYGL